MCTSWQDPQKTISLPAILKGWFDRTLAMGRSYGYGNIYATGKFRDKRALLSSTTGGSAEAYVKGGFNGDLEAILRPIQRGILQFVGIDVLAPQIHYSPVRVDDAARQAWLAAWEKRLLTIEQESPIEVGAY